jgi:hypothetical protein
VQPIKLLREWSNVNSKWRVNEDSASRFAIYYFSLRRACYQSRAAKEKKRGTPCTSLPCS